MNNDRKEVLIQFDMSLFLRELRKNLVMLLMVSGIVGMVSFLAIDIMNTTSYTASCDLVVISQNANYNTDYYIDIALSQYVSLLNSDAMKNQVAGKLGTNSGNLQISAKEVTDSNMIVLQATAETPEESYKILRAAIKSYPEISNRSGSGISLEVLGKTSVDTIQNSQSSDSVQLALTAGEIVFFLGCLLFLFRVMFSGKVQNEAQADQLLDTQCLGSVHYEKKKKEQKCILISQPSVSAFYIESIGKIATKIDYRMQQKQAKTFLVTSVLENEGKSTIAVNIAITLARRGKKVLLVDMDLKQPAVHKVLDIDMHDTPTIVDYYTRAKNFEDVIIKSREKNLYLCLGRDLVSNSDMVLEGDMTKRFLEQAEETVDYVVLDTTPCAVVNDAYVLTRLVSNVLLVVWQEKAKVRLINDCIDEMNQSDGDLLGCVLNGVLTG